MANLYIVPQQDRLRKYSTNTKARVLPVNRIVLLFLAIVMLNIMCSLARFTSLTEHSVGTAFDLR